MRIPRIRKNRKIMEKLQTNGQFNIAISILNSTLKKSTGFSNISAFGKKETVI